MSSGSWPNFNAWLQTAWGAGAEFWSSGYAGLFSAATNLVFGQNPPYTLDDFLSVYPVFFGLPLALSGCGTTVGSPTVTVPSANGLNFGQFLQGMGLPRGSVIIGTGNGTITLNQAATATQSNVTLQVYATPVVPVGVIQLYLNLAYASLVQARWQEQWYVAMAWFIAHYCTLYAQSSAAEVVQLLATALHGETPGGAVPGTVYTLSGQPPGGALQSLTKNGLFLTPGTDYTLNGVTITLVAATVTDDVLYATWPVQSQTLVSVQPTAAQVAAAGLAGGIQTSKSVGDVSVAYQVLTALEDWGAWNLTKFGQQLATMAQVIGSGPMVIW